MNTKKFFVAFVLVLLVGNAYTQERLNKRMREVVQVEEELKNVWSEPQEDFKTLSTRAMKDDPQALYALSLVCKSKDLEYARWHKYLARAAELGYAKAQLRMAIDIAKRRNVSIDDLEKASVFCRNAINDGFACATNLVPIIDKLIEKTEIANKEAEIAKREEARKREEREQMERELQLAELEAEQRARAANAEEAKAVIADPKEVQVEAEHKQQQEEQEYWRTWPQSLDDGETARLVADVEKKFNCVFLKQQRNVPRLLRSRRMPVASMCGTKNCATSTWNQGCGKSLVVVDPPWICRIDSDGRISAYGLNENRSDFDELKYYDEEHARRLDALRDNWAKERGMTLEEAKRKYDGQNGSRQGDGLLNTLHARRAPRVRKTEAELAKMRAERARRDEEEVANRAEQRKQLQAIQDELRRAREEAAKQMEESRENE